MNRRNLLKRSFGFILLIALVLCILAPVIPGVAYAKDLSGKPVYMTVSGGTARLASGTYTVQAGQTLTLYWTTSKTLNSAFWTTNASNHIQIISSSTYSCTIKGLSASPSTFLVQCDYYYWVLQGTFRYLMHGTEDFYIHVTAPPSTEPTNVTLPSTRTIQVGESIILTPVVTPTNAVTTFTWYTANSTIASVSSGLVTGRSPGSVYITVMTDNELQDTCTVNVTGLPCTVTFNSQNGSSVTGQTIAYNSLVSKPADPTREGYTFGGWHKEASCINAWNFATDKVTANLTLYAKWNIKRYTVNVLTNNAAYGTVAGQGEYAASSQVTLNAISKAGYYFVRWLEGTTQVSTSVTYTFAVTGARTLKAEFAQIVKYRISTSANNAAYGTVTGQGDYAGNTQAAVKAVPNSKCRFVRWLEGAKEISRDPVYKFTVAGNRSLKAEFTKISAPKISKVSSAGYNAVKIAWSGVSGAKGYQIYYCKSAKGTYKRVTMLTGTSYTHRGLACGTTYYYKVRAYCAAGDVTTYGSFSGYKSSKPVPSKPSGVKAVRISSSSIKVSWTAVAGRTKYEVWRAKSSKGTYSLTASPSGTKYTNSGLKKGQTYYYKVRAYRKVGNKKVYGSFSTITKAKT